MIRVDLADERTTNRIIEALYVAAGSRPGTYHADEWHQLAAQFEQALDTLPPQNITRLRDVS